MASQQPTAQNAAVPSGPYSPPTRKLVDESPATTHKSSRSKSSKRSPAPIITRDDGETIAITDFTYQHSVGKGTFGEVGLYQYTGPGKDYGRNVAIKKVFQNPEYKNREFDIQKRIDHRNIVRILVPEGIYSSAGQQRGKGKYLHIVMEHFDKSLYKAISESRKNANELHLGKIQTYLKDCLEALSFLGNVKIGHRDLKPENILIQMPRTGADGVKVRDRAAICDFGNAKPLDGEPSISYICTRMYRAPELVFGGFASRKKNVTESMQKYTHAVDMWSMGCIMAEMILTVPLFGQWVERDPQRPSESRPVDLWKEFYYCLGSVSLEDWKGMGLGEREYAFYEKSIAEVEQSRSKGKERRPVARDGAGLQKTLKNTYDYGVHQKKVKHINNGPVPFKDLMSDEFLDLMGKMLVYDPTKRLTPKEALNHPFFRQPHSPYPI